MQTDPKEPTPTFDEVWQLFRETDRKFQETNRKFQETDKRFQQLESLIKEQSKKMGEMNNRLGDFVESIVKPGIVRLFKERNIPINKLHQHVEAENKELGLATEIDFFVVNSDCCALVEVKSKLDVSHINEHIERMEKFRLLFPEYADKKAYAAVAAMIIPEDVAKYAYRKGLFVIAQKGDNITFLNNMQFEPKSW
jgi:hypothetical protein